MLSKLRSGAAAIAALTLGAVATPALAGIASIDTTYSGDGIARRDLGSNNDQVWDVYVAPSGRTYLLAYLYDNPDGFIENERYVIARLTANGGLDSSFAGDGKLVIPRSRFEPAAYGPGALFVDEAARRIYLGGAQVVSTGGNYNRFAVARLTYSGELDDTFGSGGIAAIDAPTTAPAAYSFDNVVTSVALQPDGKVVAAGYRVYASTSAEIALARFSATGQPETSFGAPDSTNGFLVLEPPTARASAGDLVVAGTGEIVLTGIAGASMEDRQLLVARLGSDGLPDASFSADGFHVDDVGSIFVALEPRVADDGTVTVAGSATIPGGDGFPNRNFIVRYTPAGERDGAYGTAGLYAEDNVDPVIFFNQPGALLPSGKVLYAYAVQDSDGDADVYDVYVRRMLGSTDLAVPVIELPDEGGGGGRLPPTLLALLGFAALARRSRRGR